MEYSTEVGIQVLARTPSVLKAMLSNVSGEWLDGRDAANAWSPREVLGHLVHIEECDWIDRLKVILEFGDKKAFDPIDREAGFGGLVELNVADLLRRFTLSRASNVRELSELVGAEDLERVGLHPEFGRVTLRQLLATWVVHDLNHVGQIVKTMAKLYGDAVGPWRAYLPIVDAI